MGAYQPEPDARPIRAGVHLLTWPRPAALDSAALLAWVWVSDLFNKLDPPSNRPFRSLP